MAQNELTQFYDLTPDVVMAGVEAVGFLPTGEYQQLNSYENRVFDLRLEPGGTQERLIVKYYRPGRWTKAAIHEEHFFLDELSHQGIPVVAPLPLKNKETIAAYQGIYLSVFPKALGRMPQELNLQELSQVGRLLARIHNVGEQTQTKHRPNWFDLGWPALEGVASFVAPEVWERYETAAHTILTYLDDAMDPDTFIRIHGDCHRGNLLQQDNRDGERGFFMVDFDDFGMGPVAQDFWMLFSGDSALLDDEQNALLGGYEELRKFPKDQYRLFMPLRELRIIHYAAWIARRWKDPSFPKIFPNFESYTYWAEETEALERIAWSLN